MYIEFVLPNGAGGMAAHTADAKIQRALAEWSSQYQIPYVSKHIKYTRRVTFDTDESYSLFALTWGHFDETKNSCLNRWRIVSDLNNKTKFDSRV